MSQLDNQPHLTVQNPFPGLSSYNETERDFFYGRNAEKDELFQRVRRDTLTVLFGKSGLGKTSLIQAGLFPLLREAQYLPILLRLSFGPEAPELEEQLSQAVTTALEQAEAEGETVRSGESMWEFFHRIHIWSSRNRLLVPVLVFDQFEEAFTLGKNDLRTPLWLQSLGDLIENRIPQSVRLRIEADGEAPDYAYERLEVRVILALREDFLPELEDLKPLIPSLAINRMRLAPLDGLRALEVVQRPVPELMNATVAEEIVRFVAGAEQGVQHDQPLDRLQIEPSLLNLICQQLNQRRLTEGTPAITADLLRGSKEQLLTDFYRACLKGLPQDLAVFVEEQLITPSGFRRAETLDNALTMPGVDQAALRTLVDRRLLRREERFGIPHLELIHDVLTQTVREIRDRRRTEAEQEAERQHEAELRAKLHRSHQRAFAGITGVILLTLGIIFYLYGWIFPYQEYARAFTKRWGITQPVGTLSGSAVTHRAWTYRFIYKGRFEPWRKLQKMEVVDAHQQLIDGYIRTHLSDPNAPSSQQDQVSQCEFAYDHKGRVVSEIARNRFGQMIWGFLYAPLGGQDKGDESAKAMFVGPDGYLQPRSHSRAEFVEIRYDSRGFEVEHQYTDREGEPAPGPDDAYGRLMTYDTKGRPVQVTSLNELGIPINDKVGNAGMNVVYDMDSNIIEWWAFDAAGEPTLVKAGYYGWRAKYDQWGREAERSFFDLHGNPVVDMEQTGAHRIVWEFDDRGNITSTKLYNQGNSPIVAGWQLFEIPAHEQRLAYNEQNRAETVAYFDSEGKPITGTEGWHGYWIEYDKRGFGSAFSSFDGNNKPTNHLTTGAHRQQRINNDFGQAFEERFFDTGGNAINILDGGYHLRKNRYDRAGNLVEQSYFGVHDETVTDRASRAHRVIWQFDRFRNPILTGYFDESGQPINNSQGFHRTVYTYNTYGNPLETRWYDKDDGACDGPDGMHNIRYEYDNRGLLTRILRYDPNNQPATDNKGIHKTLNEYNDKRQQTRYQVFGLHDEPVEDMEWDHLVLNEFDQRGRETKVTRLRANGSPNWNRELGIATRTQRWNRENQWIEQAYFNERNRLIIGPFGYARGTREFASDGSSTDILYGTDNTPQFNALMGWAIRKSDSQGNTSSYHDPEGALTTGPDGYAEVRRDLNEKRELVSQAFYGPDGTPVAGPEGYHRAEITADSIRYFDARGDDITSISPEAFISVIYIAEIPSVGQIPAVQQPAAKVGLHAGDILWQYGNWSFSEELKAERVRGTVPDKVTKAIAQAFIAEIKRISTESVQMTVIRNGEVVEIIVPPQANKLLGISMKERTIPLATFNFWKSLTPSLR